MVVVPSLSGTTGSIVTTGAFGGTITGASSTPGGEIKPVFGSVIVPFTGTSSPAGGSTDVGTSTVQLYVPSAFGVGSTLALYSCPSSVTITSAFGLSTVPVSVVVPSLSGTTGLIVMTGAMGASGTFG